MFNYKYSQYFEYVFEEMMSYLNHRSRYMFYYTPSASLGYAVCTWATEG